MLLLVPGPKGQDRWAKDYPYCGGAQQTPIDITPDLLKFDSTLPPIQVQNYDLQPSDALTLGNNGHSCEYIVGVDPERTLLTPAELR